MISKSMVDEQEKKARIADISTVGSKGNSSSNDISNEAGEGAALAEKTFSKALERNHQPKKPASVPNALRRACFGMRRSRRCASLHPGLSEGEKLKHSLTSFLFSGGI